MIARLDLRRRGPFGRFLPARDARIFIGDSSVPYDGESARNKLHEFLSGQRCLVLVHGYNSPEAGVMKSYGTIIERLQSNGLYNPWVPDAAYERVLQVLWPGHSAAGYHLAEAAAEGWLFKGAGDRLHAALAASTPASLDIIAHSAGNRVTGDANRLGDLPIRNWFLCAPAVSCKSICLGGEFERAVAAVSGKAVVFQSYDDLALKAFRWAKAGDLALGYGEGRGAGLTPRTVVFVNGNEWLHGHSDFKNSPEFYEHIRDVA